MLKTGEFTTEDLTGECLNLVLIWLSELTSMDQLEDTEEEILLKKKPSLWVKTNTIMFQPETKLESQPTPLRPPWLQLPPLEEVSSKAEAQVLLEKVELFPQLEAVLFLRELLKSEILLVMLTPSTEAINTRLNIKVDTTGTTTTP